jgi:hypothetical protein
MKHKALIKILQKVPGNSYNKHPFRLIQCLLNCKNFFEHKTSGVDMCTSKDCPQHIRNPMQMFPYIKFAYRSICIILVWVSMCCESYVRNIILYVHIESVCCMVHIVQV